MGNRKSLQRAKHEHKLKYTVIIAPNTYGSTYKFSLSAFLIKNIIFLAGLAAVACGLLIFSYIGLLENYNQSKQDLLTLQSINKNQQQQLYQMDELVKDIDQKLIYLNLLETKVKEMMDDESSNAADNPKIAEIDAKLAEVDTNGVGGNSGDSDTFLHYFTASADVSSLDISSELESIRLALSDKETIIEGEQGKFADLQQEWLQNSDYAQCYPDFIPAAGTISSYFGYRTYPRAAFHSGLDIANARGTKEYAAGRGKVIQAGWNGAYGLSITIDHGYGLRTLYGHCSKILVSVGDIVEKGDLISLMGTTGYSTGNHLHFEVYENGVRVNPTKYIDITQIHK